MTSKAWNRRAYSSLTKEAKRAKKLLQGICDCLTKHGGRLFYLEMGKYCDTYEGHIIDSGKCVDDPNDPYDVKYDPNGDEDVGMIFFGGYFCTHKTSHRRAYGKEAQSKAWVSLLEDCMGIGEMGEHHTLTDHLKGTGPELDFNCKSIDELEKKIGEYLR